VKISQPVELLTWAKPILKIVAKEMTGFREVMQ